MSKYYDLAKPFSLANWKLLIEDVNDILENPPEGSDCEPIEPIEEPEAPKMWEVKDVEEVRDKLIETCPDIEFKAELEIWRPDIIDEIEKAMEQAWCNCTGGDKENEYGPFTVEDVEELHVLYTYVASPHCWGQCVLCGGCCYLGSSEGPVYPPSDANYKETAMLPAFNLAQSNTVWYITAINDARRLSKEIEQRQRMVDTNVAAAQAAADQYENCIAVEGDDCWIYKSQACFYGTQAKSMQKELDKKVTEFKKKLKDKDTYQVAADNAAKDNWSQALSIEGQYPIDINVFSLTYQDFLNLPWMKWFNPDNDDEIGVAYNCFRGVWDQDEIRAAGLIFCDNVTGSDLGAAVRISPGGFPYVDKMLLLRLGIGHSTEDIISVLDQPAQGCPVEAYTLEINGKQEFGPGYIFDEWLVKTTVHALRKDKDYTEEQEEYWAKYDNWYKEHPKYDDRFQQYC